MSLINDLNIKWKLIQFVNFNYSTAKIYDQNEYDSQRPTKKRYIHRYIYILYDDIIGISTHNVCRPNNNNSKHRSTSRSTTSESVVETIKKLAISWNLDSHTHAQTYACMHAHISSNTYIIHKKKKNTQLMGYNNDNVPMMYE